MKKKSKIPVRSAQGQKFMRDNPPNSEMGKRYAKAASNGARKALRLEWAQQVVENAEARLVQTDQEETVDESVGEYLPFYVIWEKEGKNQAGYEAVH